MSDEQELNALAEDLVEDASESFEQSRAEQQAFLDDVAAEEGAELLETQCNIKGHTVPVSATLNGELMDAMSRIDSKMERLESGDGRAYEYSEVADEVSQILADVTEDPALTKRAFYETYKEHNLDPLGAILEAVFTALKEERERRHGVADGFRP